jgi:hypothetical protein
MASYKVTFKRGYIRGGIGGVNSRLLGLIQTGKIGFIGYIRCYKLKSLNPELLTQNFEHKTLNPEL